MALRGGRYETIGKIASGGMAQVLLGRTVGVGGFERLVAIKAMHEHLQSEPEFVAMFLDEARLAARIHHPNVVSTLDVDEDEDGVFIVMEYVEGPPLNAVQRAMRQSGRRIPLDVALRIFLDTLAGLHAAHELAGVNGEPLHLVHRDVSPQNILVGVDGIARLTDFGVARAESRLAGTGVGQIKGKLAFMAPEQLSSKPVDRRADVYAAGVVLWEMLTCQRLLPGDNDIATITQVLAGKRRSPREVDPTIPLEIEAACMKALEPLPQDRFASAAAFAEAIETSGEPISAPRGVAAFVTELNIHKRPTGPASLRSGGDSVNRPTRTGISTGRHIAGTDVSLATSRSSPGSDASHASHASRAGPSTLPTAHTHASLTVAPRRGRLVVTAAGGLGVVMALSWVALHRSAGVVSPTASAGSVVSAVAQVPAIPVTPRVTASAPLDPVSQTPPAGVAGDATVKADSAGGKTGELTTGALIPAESPGASALAAATIHEPQPRLHVRAAGAAAPKASSAPSSQPPTSSTSYRPGAL